VRIKNKIRVERILPRRYGLREMPEEPGMLKIITGVSQQDGARMKRTGQRENYTERKANQKGHGVGSRPWAPSNTRFYIHQYGLGASGNLKQK